MKMRAAYSNKNMYTRKFLGIQRVITRKELESSHFGSSDADGRDSA